MLSHANILADVCGVCFQLGANRPCSTDVMISYLPLAHMLERSCQVAMLMTGGALGFFRGDIRTLPDDMKALRPTLFPTVPRLMNRIHDKVWSEVSSSPIKKAILKLALARKETELRRCILRRDSIWDKLVFRKVQESMGGRVRLVVVGSAPMDASVLTFMRCALGCIIVEGYGQTECVSPCTLTVQGDYLVDHVGPPLPCNLVKLVDVPEMEYFASAGQGEVCVKGANVFQGYFKNPQKTAETIDRDGWLHTGDIGMWLPNGTLRIVDRKKHIFKLSIGEYVAPEKIENIYSRSEYVSQIFIHGESLKSSIVAIVVPDVVVVKQYAEYHGMEGTFSVLCSNAAIKQLIMDDMVRLGADAGLKSFEQVKDIYLHPDPFSVQNGLLTPTLKSKRPDLRRYFKPQLDDMYSRLI
jgi:long-chain acyl-CoA synthetase